METPNDFEVRTHGLVNQCTNHNDTLISIGISINSSRDKDQSFQRFQL